MAKRGRTSLTAHQFFMRVYRALFYYFPNFKKREGSERRQIAYRLAFGRTRKRVIVYNPELSKRRSERDPALVKQYNDNAFTFLQSHGDTSQ